MDLIVTKWIALEGAVLLEKEKEEELLQYFPEALLREVRGFEKYLSVEEETRIASCFGAADIQELAQGGIFTALWILAERMNAGLDVDLRKIPVKQEIIELCEYFGLNPYQMLSGGSLLIGTGNGLAMVSELENRGIHGVLIGRTTEGNDRILRNCGNVRYLDRPQREELYKLDEIRKMFLAL